MTQTDRLVQNAERYPERSGHDGTRPTEPGLAVALVSCMDSRMDLFSLFGLQIGDAHIIRNAGGVVTDDVVRSLAISQRFLKTREIILVHHTKCGLHGLDDEKLAADLESETGQRPSWRAGGFADPYDDVRRSIERIRSDPFVPSKQVRGFVFDVTTGDLKEVVAD